jgi:hypothetical protein
MAAICPRMLIEISPADFKAATSDKPPAWAQGFTFRKVEGQTAHAWVKGGGIHETALYMGEDRHGVRRIRYARDGI